MNSMLIDENQDDLGATWFIFNYYLTEEKRLCNNLSNQSIDYFIPKVNVLKNNKNSLINLFPGYGFANLPSLKLSSLKYTKGIKTILANTNGFASVSPEYVNHLNQECEKTKFSPIIVRPNVGDVVQINKGPFKDYLAKVINLDKNQRISLMMTLLSREFTFEIEPNDIKYIF